MVLAEWETHIEEKQIAVKDGLDDNMGNNDEFVCYKKIISNWKWARPRAIFYKGVFDNWYIVW